MRLVVELGVAVSVGVPEELLVLDGLGVPDCVSDGVLDSVIVADCDCDGDPDPVPLGDAVSASPSDSPSSSSYCSASRCSRVTATAFQSRTASTSPKAFASLMA